MYRPQDSCDHISDCHAISFCRKPQEHAVSEHGEGNSLDIFWTDYDPGVQ